MFKKLISYFVLAGIFTLTTCLPITLATEETTPERNFEYYCHKPYWDPEEEMYLCERYLDDVWDYYEFNEVGWIFKRDSALSYDGEIYTYEGEHFTFHYTNYLWDQLTGETELGFGVSTDILRVDGTMNLIPDIIDDIEFGLEEIREYTLDSLGLEPTQLPEHVDVYLDDYGFADVAYITDGSNETRRHADNEPYMIFDPYDENIGYSAVYEFFHTLLLSYNEESSLMYDVKFAEGTAKWLSDQVRSNGQNYLERIGEYMENPMYSVFDSVNPEDAELFQYGTSLWVEYLTLEFGEEVVRDIWEYYFSEEAAEYSEGNARIYRSVERVLAEEYYKSFRDVFFDYVREIYIKTNLDTFQELPDVYVTAQYNTYPVEAEMLAEEELPYMYGFNVFEFKPAPTKESYQNLVIKIENADPELEKGWELRFIGEKSNGNKVDMTRNEIRFEAGEKEGTTVFKNIWENYEKMTMIVVPTGDPELLNDAENCPYYYSAYLYTTQELEENYDLIMAGYVDGEVEVREVFSDIEEDNANQEAIGYLYEEGVIGGYDDGTFKPENPVNRAELLKILVEGQGVSPSVEEYSDCFPDVADDWYAAYVCYALEEGWVNGYPDGTFRPADTVNKVEALKMLINSQGLDWQLPEVADEDPWYQGYVDFAENRGLLEEVIDEFMPDDEMNRGGICENLFRLLVVLETGAETFVEELIEEV